MTDLDAIRARDAAWTDQYLVAPDGFQSAHDRRDLLAEVDRLRAEVLSLQAAWRDSEYAEQEGRDAERARALPVIEAARVECRETDFPMCALRAALAEYDR